MQHLITFVNYCILPVQHLISLCTVTLLNTRIFFSIDGTEEIGQLGRLVNDSPSSSRTCNSKMTKIMLKNRPCLTLFATRNIARNEELRFDYGDVKAWWREVNTCFIVRYPCISFQNLTENWIETFAPDHLKFFGLLFIFKKTGHMLTFAPPFPLF